MENSEYPAFARAAFYNAGGDIDSPSQIGLTKLEYAAIKIVQGLYASRAPSSQLNAEIVCSTAIKAAKELFKQLEDEH